MLDDFSALIQSASAERAPLRIVGGGSKNWFGNSLGTGDQDPNNTRSLDMRAYRGIIDYDPSELVLSARAGTPLSEIEMALTDANQMLPFEPPHYDGGATLGGAIASGLSGPRRMAGGAARDVVLGIAMMDGGGTLLRFGGQVVKNVAGYDVSRLMAGALGTLGPLLELSLRTVPRPAKEISRRLLMSRTDALRALHTWTAAGLPITASTWEQDDANAESDRKSDSGVLSVRLGGAIAAVRHASERIGGDLLDDDTAYWCAIRDHHTAFFQDRRHDTSLWRIALPPTAAFDIKHVLSHAMPGARCDGELIEWNGGQRWYRMIGETEALRTQALEAGGHATRFRAAADASCIARADAATDTDTISVFTRPLPGLMSVHQRLKARFDPSAIFNRGRWFADF